MYICGVLTRIIFCRYNKGVLFSKKGGLYMPLVRIEIIKGKSHEYKKNVLDAVHDGLVKSLGIEDWDRFQRLYEIDDEYFERSDEKTDSFTMIELTLFPGRTKEQKGKAIELVTKELTERVGIPAKEIFIVINDPPLENWGFGGVQKS